jgi:hypothetical protein
MSYDIHVLRSLTNDELLTRVKGLATRERQATAAAPRGAFPPSLICCVRAT